MAGLDELYKSTIGKIDTPEERFELTKPIRKQFGKIDEAIARVPGFGEFYGKLGNLLPEIVSAADKQEVLDAGKDVTDDILSGNIDMGTAGRGMDLTTAALYSLVPGLSSKVVEEAGTPIAQAAIDKLGVTGANVKDNLDEIIEGINFFPYFKKKLYTDFKDEITERTIGPGFLREKGEIGDLKHGTGFGTPEEPTFDYFDKSYMSSGQGSQAFSDGHYFGTLDDVTDFYRIHGVFKKAYNDPKFANEAFEKVDGVDFIEAAKRFASHPNKKIRRRKIAEFLSMHGDKLRDGFGAVKEVTSKALKERMAHWNSPITIQSKEIQSAFRKTGEDLNKVFEEIKVLLPNQVAKINEIQKKLFPPSRKEGKIFKVGMPGFFSRDVGQIINNWKDLAKELALDAMRTGGIGYSVTGRVPPKNAKVDALKNKIFAPSFIEDMLAKNGLHGIKLRPGQNFGGISEADKDKLNYVIYDEMLVNPDDSYKQLELDFGED
tara:strand:- start:2244 stop:3713 length:1470 start_codon:yes stop_codon:yes gene_type:complete